MKEFRTRFVMGAAIGVASVLIGYKAASALNKRFDTQRCIQVSINPEDNVTIIDPEEVNERFIRFTNHLKECCIKNGVRAITLTMEDELHLPTVCWIDDEIEELVRSCCDEFLYIDISRSMDDIYRYTNLPEGAIKRIYYEFSKTCRTPAVRGDMIKQVVGWKNPTDDLDPAVDFQDAITQFQDAYRKVTAWKFHENPYS